MTERTSTQASPSTQPAGPAAVDGPWDPQGLRRVVVGAVVAVLAPLFGFLAGSMVGTSRTGGTDPMFLWMFVGLVIGAAGAFLAFTGGLAWFRANRMRL